MIDYILLAEFDIQAGGVLRLQYPEPVPNSNPEL